MKRIYLPLFILILTSCTTDRKEDACFENDKKEKTAYKEFRLDTPQEILRANPSHIKFTINKNIKSYNEEIEDDRKSHSEAEDKKRYKAYDHTYAKLIKNFGEQFYYINIGETNGIVYGIGENMFGYWLLEAKNNTADAYYLGLSQFTHLSKKQPEHFISGNKLVAYGSFIRISKSWGYPFGPQKEAVKDWLVFEIDLANVKKDSDNDGFNDLFEKQVLLNPNSADTDQDGIPDFTDSNPLYRSEKSKFTDLYTLIIDRKYEQSGFSKDSYFFTGYFSDCDYFHRINPTRVKVLIYPENKSSELQSDYRLGMFPEYIGKIKRDKDKNKFFIDYASGSGGGFFEAVFKNGQWNLSKHGTYNI
ncbi:hypothetical protein QE422_002118 [Chryseobacterium sp. SORGH_AS 447]|uniref:hypothetical protein n=1 Tax=Chryseobacterium sp. SORGH_AS_0447 TaxID=3041769 RepID=UPI0027823569|nr:hypothetical protein [Chryseobacterium sp. SORGH_AS_0447]MDQ1161750.1 hypothetical protein [Chryseobacterium sp. SORGH_AS_0447]